jgi:ribosomal protein L21E
MGISVLTLQFKAQLHYYAQLGLSRHLEAKKEGDEVFLAVDPGTKRCVPK